MVTRTQAVVDRNARGCLKPGSKLPRGSSPDEGASRAGRRFGNRFSVWIGLSLISGLLSAVILQLPSDLLTARSMIAVWGCWSTWEERLVDLPVCVDGPPSAMGAQLARGRKTDSISELTSASRFEPTMMLAWHDQPTTEAAPASESQSARPEQPANHAQPPRSTKSENLPVTGSQRSADASADQAASDPKTAEAAEAARARDAADAAESFELLQMFVDTLDQVERNYVRPVPRRELIEAAIEGMLSKLDQHSDYISPREFESFRLDVESEFGGIGLQITKPNLEAEVTITSLIPETPAYRAGLLAGDTITQIDDKPTKGLALQAAVELMKGPVGSVVRLSVRRLSGELEQKELTREVIRVATVLGDRKQPNGVWNYVIDPQRKLGYIRISVFARHTAEELKKVLEQLAAAGVQGLVLDLRQNPGGLLTSAIDVADLFLDEGVIVSISGRNVEARTYEARQPDTYRQFALAVLIDRFSASASEIVAASLQDHHRAVIIGERSYGKGSVQNVVELVEGRSAIKLTTATYIRPNGKNIHRFEGLGEDADWGVLPDQDYRIVLSLRDLRQLALARSRRDLGLETAEDAALAPQDTALQRALDYIAERAAKGEE